MRLAFPIFFSFQRNVLMDAHTLAHGTPMVARAEGGQTASGRGEAAPRNFIRSDNAVTDSEPQQ